MKVKELIEILKNLPKNTQVIMSKDAEGNTFTPLDEVETNNIYVPESSWYGNIYHESWSAEDAMETEEGWNEILKQPRCVVLWPIN